MVELEKLKAGDWLAAEDYGRAGKGGVARVLQVFEIIGDRAHVGRFDGWADGKPVFGRQTSVSRETLRNRIWTVTAAPAPPVPAMPPNLEPDEAVLPPMTEAATEPSTLSLPDEVRLLRLELAALRADLCGALACLPPEIRVAIRGSDEQAAKVFGEST